MTNRSADKRSLLSRLKCWLGFHPWCYADARNRRCLICPRIEERVGMSGLEEIWRERS